MSTRRRASANRILSGLPGDELGRLTPHFETVDLAYGEVLCDVGEKIRHAVFPNAGIVSLLAPVDGGAMLEVGLLGREGMSGLPLALGMKSTGDQMESDRFALTQAFLADMLGVQRVAVTRAASALQNEGLIDYSRGAVSILDRPRLEAASCDCYRIANGIYRAGLR